MHEPLLTKVNLAAATVEYPICHNKNQYQAPNMTLFLEKTK